MKQYAKHIAYGVLIAALIVSVSVLGYSSTATKVAVRQSVTGFGSWTSFSGTLAASADTAVCNFSGFNTRDSMYIVVRNYTTGGARTALRLHLLGSMDNVSWLESTLGTDSTTFSTTASTAATAKVTVIAISPLQYYNWPYRRILVSVPTTGNTETTKWRIDIVTTVTGR